MVSRSPLAAGVFVLVFRGYLSNRRKGTTNEWGVSEARECIGNEARGEAGGGGGGNNPRQYPGYTLAVAKLMYSQFCDKTDHQINDSPQHKLTFSTHVCRHGFSNIHMPD